MVRCFRRRHPTRRRQGQGWLVACSVVVRPVPVWVAKSLHLEAWRGLTRAVAVVRNWVERAVRPLPQRAASAPVRDAGPQAQSPKAATSPKPQELTEVAAVLRAIRDAARERLRVQEMAEDSLGPQIAVARAAAEVGVPRNLQTSSRKHPLRAAAERDRVPEMRAASRAQARKATAGTMAIPSRLTKACLAGRARLAGAEIGARTVGERLDAMEPESVPPLGAGAGT